MKQRIGRILGHTLGYLMVFLVGAIGFWLIASLEYRKIPLFDFNFSKISISYSDSVLIILTALGIVVAIVTIVVGLLAVITLKRIRSTARRTARKQAEKQLRIAREHAENQLKVAIDEIPMHVKREVRNLSGGIYEIMKSSEFSNQKEVNEAIDNFLSGFLDDKNYDAEPEN